MEKYSLSQYECYHKAFYLHFILRLEEVFSLLCGRSNSANIKDISNVVELLRHCESILFHFESDDSGLMQILSLDQFEQIVQTGRNSSVPIIEAFRVLGDHWETDPEADILLSFQWKSLQRTINGAAYGAVSRYRMFLQKCSDTDATELGKLSSARAWEYITRKFLTITANNLLTGILKDSILVESAGHGGRRVKHTLTDNHALDSAGIAHQDGNGIWQYYIHPRDKGVDFPTYGFMLILDDDVVVELMVETDYIPFTPDSMQKSELFSLWVQPLTYLNTGNGGQCVGTHYAVEASPQLGEAEQGSEEQLPLEEKIRLQQLKMDWFSFNTWKDTCKDNITMMKQFVGALTTPDMQRHLKHSYSTSHKASHLHGLDHTPTRKLSGKILNKSRQNDSLKVPTSSLALSTVTSNRLLINNNLIDGGNDVSSTRTQRYFDKSISSTTQDGAGTAIPQQAVVFDEHEFEDRLSSISFSKPVTAKMVSEMREPTFDTKEHALLVPLYNHYVKDTGLNTRLSRLLLNYVSRDVSVVRDVSTDRSPLTKQLDRFLCSRRRDALLLLGESGSGKSLCAQMCRSRIWNSWLAGTADAQNEFVCVVLDCAKIVSFQGGDLFDPCVGDNVLLRYMKASPLGYEPGEVQELRNKYRFLFILDGLEHYVAHVKHLNRDSSCNASHYFPLVSELGLHHWPGSKLIILANTNFWTCQTLSFKYSLLLAAPLVESNATPPKMVGIRKKCLASLHGSPPLLTYFLKPFTESQVNSFINNSIAVSHAWYRHYHNCGPAFKALYSEPSLLSLFLNAAEKHMKKNVYDLDGAGWRKLQSTYEVCEYLVHQWLDEVKKECLSEKQIQLPSLQTAKDSPEEEEEENIVETLYSVVSSRNADASTMQLLDTVRRSIFEQFCSKYAENNRDRSYSRIFPVKFGTGMKIIDFLNETARDSTALSAGPIQMVYGCQDKVTDSSDGMPHSRGGLGYFKITHQLFFDFFVAEKLWEALLDATTISDNSSEYVPDRRGDSISDHDERSDDDDDDDEEVAYSEEDGCSVPITTEELYLLWNGCYMNVEEPGVLNQLVERLQALHASDDSRKKAAVESKLLDLVFFSRKQCTDNSTCNAFDKKVGEVNVVDINDNNLQKVLVGSNNQALIHRAASNAISLLNMTKFDFSNKVPRRDLSCVCIPYANLCGARLSFMNMTDANLSHCVLTDAILVQCQFKRANLTGVYVFNERMMRKSFSDKPVGALAVFDWPGGVVAVEHRTYTYSSSSRCASSSSSSRGIITPVVPNGGEGPSARAVGLDEGSMVAFGEHWDVIVCSIGSASNIKRLKGHTAEVVSVAFAPSTINSSGILASGGRDNLIIVWDCCFQGPEICCDSGCGNHYKKLQIIRGHSDWITCLTFTRSGQALASGSFDRTIRLWDVATFVCPNTVGKTNFTKNQSPNASSRVESSPPPPLSDSMLCLDECTNTVGSKRDSSAHSGSYSYADAVVKGGGDSGVSGNSASAASIASLMSATKSDESDEDLISSNARCLGVVAAGQVTTLAYCPVTGYLASGSSDNLIKLWDPASIPLPLFRPSPATTRGDRESIYNDGLFSADLVGEEVIPTPDAELRTFGESKILGGINSLSFSPDGLLAAGCRWSAAVSLIDITSSSAQPVRLLKGHTGWVNSVCFGSNGLLVTGSDDKSVKIWDVRNSPANSENKAAKRDAKVRNHGGTCEMAGRVGEANQSTDTVEDDESLCSFQDHTDAVLSVAVAADTGTILSGGKDHLLNIRNRAMAARFGTPWNENNRYGWGAFGNHHSSASRCGVSTHEGSALTVSNRRVTYMGTAGAANSHCGAASNRNARVRAGLVNHSATGESSGGGAPPENGVHGAEYYCHKENITSMACSADGLLVTAAESDHLRFWDTSQKTQPLATEPESTQRSCFLGSLPPEHYGKILSLSFVSLSDKRYTCDSSSNTSSESEAASIEKSSSTTTADAKTCTTTTADAKTCTGMIVPVDEKDAGGEESGIYRLTPPLLPISRSPVATTPQSKTNSVNIGEQSKCHTSSSYCSSSSSSNMSSVFVSGGEDNTIRVWIPSTSSTSASSSSKVTANSGTVNNASSIASPRSLGSVYSTCRNAFPFQATEVIRGHNGAVTCLSFASDGLLASGSEDHTVKLWRVAAVEEILQQRQRQQQQQPSVAQNPLPAGASLPPAQDFRKSGSNIASPREMTPSIAPSPDTRRRKRSVCLISFTKHTGSITSLAFSLCSPSASDVVLLASGSDDKSIILWNITEAVSKETTTSHLNRSVDTSTVTSSDSVAILAGHTSAVTGLAFVTGNRTLVSGSRDKTIRFWQIDSIDGSVVCFRSAAAHSGPVHHVSYNAEHRMLTTCSYGETLFWITSNNNWPSQPSRRLAFGGSHSLICGTALVLCRFNSLNILDVEKLTKTGGVCDASSNSKSPPHQSPFEASSTSAQAPAVVDTSVSFRSHCPPTLWLQGSSMQGAKGVSPILAQFLLMQQHVPVRVLSSVCAALRAASSAAADAAGGDGSIQNKQLLQLTASSSISMPGMNQCTSASERLSLEGDEPVDVGAIRVSAFGQTPKTPDNYFADDWQDDRELNVVDSTNDSNVNHPAVLEALGKVREGRVYYKTKEYAKALDSAAQALTLYKSVYGEHAVHRNIANTLNSMGQVCRHTGDFLIAVDFYSQALRMLCTLYGANASRSHDVAELYNCLGKCYKEVQRDDLATQYFNKALELYKGFPAHSCDDQIYRLKKHLKKLARRSSTASSDGSSSDGSVIGHRARNFITQQSAQMTGSSSTSPNSSSTAKKSSASGAAAAAKARARAAHDLKKDLNACMVC